MKAALCLLFCVLLLEQVHFLSASDDDEDLFESFFPESKGKPSKGTTAKGSASVHTRAKSSISGPGSVGEATKEVVTTGVTTTSTSSVHTESSVESHSSFTRYEPAEPGDEKPGRGKGRGKGKKTRKGPRSGEGESTTSSKKHTSTESTSSFDFGALTDKFFGDDDDGDVVY